MFHFIMEQFRCEKCLIYFDNYYSLRSHKGHCNKSTTPKKSRLNINNLLTQNHDEESRPETEEYDFSLDKDYSSDSDSDHGDDNFSEHKDTSSDNTDNSSEGNYNEEASEKIFEFDARWIPFHEINEHKHNPNYLVDQHRYAEALFGIEASYENTLKGFNAKVLTKILRCFPQSK